MQIEDLIVEVRDANLARLGQLTTDDKEGLTLAARANAVGSWTIDLPDMILDETTGRDVPHALCAALRKEGAGIVITGPDGVILSGPTTEAKFAATDEDPEGVWTITGVSDLILLQDALAYPDPATADPAAQRYTNDTRTGKAEDLIRQYVAYNIANGATRTPAATWAPSGRLVGFRTKLGLTATSLGQGPTLTYSPRFQNLLELCQDIAVAGGLLFDVAQNGAILELRVWAPVDRSKFVRMDVQNQGLASVEYGFGSPTATRPIVAGQGEGTARTILERTSAAAQASEALWGRRIERFVDQRQTDDLGELQQAGDTVLLQEAATVSSMQVTPSDDLAMVFLRDWGLGDVVSVVVGAVETRARVTEAALKVDNGVLIGATVGDPEGFEFEDVQASRVTSTESRVSSLERNAEASGTPSGALNMWAGQATAIPSGWLLCDGRAVSRTNYADLFAALGTAYGAGDGSTTFNLPNMKGRVPVGVDSTQTEFATLGKTGGEKAHTLTIAEMPNHSHNFQYAGTGYPGFPYGAVGDTGGGLKFFVSKDSYGGTNAISIAASGGGQAHNVLQPYVSMNYIIKA